jgi:hypothetical protein
MVLVCNAPESADRLLDGLRHDMCPAAMGRLARIRVHARVMDAGRLLDDGRYTEACTAVARIDEMSA